MRKSKSSLFLMELLLAILFFSVASAVCIQLFAKSHLLSRDAAALNAAVNYSQSAAAILETSYGSPDALIRQYPDGSLSENIFTLSLDDNFQPSMGDSGSYQLTVTISTSGDRMRQADITFYELPANRKLYTLQADYYMPLTK